MDNLIREYEECKEHNNQLTSDDQILRDNINNVI